MPDSPRAAATYRADLLRAPFGGFLEAGWQTFALVVAIRYFDAPETAKAFIAGSGPMGFLLTPVSLFFAAKAGLRPNTACFIAFGVAGLLMVGASLATTLVFFATLTIAGQMAAVQNGPMMLQIYAENYPPDERGRRLSTPLILTALAAIVFSVLGGRLLDRDMESFRAIFGVMVISAIISAFLVRRIPSRGLSTEKVGNPWQNFSLVWKDRLFGFLLGTWMLLGLGNLIALPIRVEYLANPAYGINANNTTIAILMMMVPATARLLSIRAWGHLFDKLHFVTVRNLLNLFFLLSIGLFFFSKNLVVLGIAMACQGLAMGGGRIFWNLWVTKIAPTEKASSYMSIHMALTGLRGTIAPFIGYWILSRSAPTAVAITGLVLIGVSIVLFEFVRGHKRLTARV